jgi:hypothetical protein
VSKNQIYGFIILFFGSVSLIFVYQNIVSFLWLIYCVLGIIEYQILATAHANKSLFDMSVTSPK